jgi:hypothetical protein
MNKLESIGLFSLFLPSGPTWLAVATIPIWVPAWALCIGYFAVMIPIWVVKDKMYES